MKNFVRQNDVYYDYDSIDQSIECYSMGLLTYIRTLKTGSTFFNDLFKRIWWKCDLKTLDYRQTRAFGYIGDPIARRAKGIAEWVVQSNLSNYFISNKTFRTGILNAPCLDMHTASLFDLFGDYCYITDWIPVDYEDHNFAMQQTEFLLNQHKIFKVDWNLKKVHRGNKLYKQVEEIALEEMQTHLEPLVVNYLYKDMLLYKKVMEHFDPESETWEKRSWLTGLR